MLCHVCDGAGSKINRLTGRDDACPLCDGIRVQATGEAGRYEITFLDGSTDVIGEPYKTRTEGVFAAEMRALREAQAAWRHVLLLRERTKVMFP